MQPLNLLPLERPDTLRPFYFAPDLDSLRKLVCTRNLFERELAEGRNEARNLHRVSCARTLLNQHEQDSGSFTLPDSLLGRVNRGEDGVLCFRSLPAPECGATVPDDYLAVARSDLLSALDKEILRAEEISVRRRLNSLTKPIMTRQFDDFFERMTGGKNEVKVLKHRDWTRKIPGG